MSNRFLHVFIVTIFFTFFNLQSACQAKGVSSGAFFSNVRLTPNDRVLILAPHPDDEVLGCGGIIQKALARKLPVKVVFFTYGDNNEWSFLIYRKHPVFFSRSVQGMGMIRHDEAIEADKVLGLSPEQLIFLGYPDFGTLNIWYNHWDERSPFKSMLTKVRAVPYKNAFRPGALYKGEEVLSDLMEILKEFKPTKIFLSHPADHNVDHRALYLFTNVAIWDLGIESRIKLYPFLVHYKSWPQPKGNHPQEKLLPPDLYKKEISWEVNALNSDEATCKETSLKKHRSQFKIAAAYLSAFIKKNELFGDFIKIGVDKKTIPVSYSFDGKIGLTNPVSTVNGKLIFSLNLSRGLIKGAGFSVYLFGYKREVPFAKMPKIHMRCGVFLRVVHDQNKRIALRNSGIKITRQGRRIIISVPLGLLGNPERILISANNYFGNIPLGWVSWRIILLGDELR